MTRKEEINDFIANYLEQYNGDSYEAYAEKEDIARACKDAIEWANRTMLDKVCKWLNDNFTTHDEDGTLSIASYVFATEEEMLEDLKNYMKGE